MDDDFKKNLQRSYLYIIQLKKIFIYPDGLINVFDVCTSIISLNAKII